MKKFQCYLCSKCLTSTDSLKKHLMLHWNEKPFECHVCEKKFVKNSHLTLHLQIHSGVRPHLCGECGKSFKTKGHLKEHSKVHTGERKVYQCMECNAEYFGLHDLQIHMRRHNGDLPFSCPHCPKRFRSKRNLDNHQRIHTGDKPFKCKSCGKAFTSTSALCQHFKKVAVCREYAANVPGSYSKPKSSDEAKNEFDLTNCIVLDSIDLRLTTAASNDSHHKPIVYITKQDELKRDDEAGTRLDPSISLPTIFLENG